MEPSSRRHIKCVSVVELLDEENAHMWAVKTKSISKKYDRWGHQTVAYLATFLLNLPPSCRDIFGGICLVTLTQRFGELSKMQSCMGNWSDFSQVFARLGLFSEAPRVDCAPPSHSSLDALEARSKRAQLTSPVLTAVDRAPCSPTPSGAFIAVTSSTAHLARTRAHLFHPVAFQNVSRSDGGVSRPPGRAPCRLRTTRTDAPRPTRIP